MLLDRLNKYQELTRAFHRDLLTDNKTIVEAQNQVRSTAQKNESCDAYSLAKGFLLTGSPYLRRYTCS